jgi:hypothetical protein
MNSFAGMSESTGVQGELTYVIIEVSHVEGALDEKVVKSTLPTTRRGLSHVIASCLSPALSSWMDTAEILEYTDASARSLPEGRRKYGYHTRVSPLDE